MVSTPSSSLWQRTQRVEAEAQVSLLTPSKTPWLTSDFPIVEGTPLLTFTDVAPAGELTFEPVLPIRGQYQMEVAVTPRVTGAFEPFEQTLTFSVPENLVKYRNAAILVAVLLLAGLGSGWVLAAPAVQQSQGVEVQLLGDTQAAVGQLATFTTFTVRQFQLPSSWCSS